MGGLTCSARPSKYSFSGYFCERIIIISGLLCAPPGLFLKLFVFNTYLVVIHVLVVPVALEPVLRSILLHKIVDSVSEVVGFEQQQLDYEVANLSLVIFMATHRLEEEEWRSEVFSPRSRHISVISAHQAQDESVQSDDVVLPDHVVEYFNAFVELLSSS